MRFLKAVTNLSTHQAFLPTLYKTISFHKPGTRHAPTPLTGLLPFLSTSRVVIFGEQHNQPNILRAQLGLLIALANLRAGGSTLTLVLEMFSLEQQHVLDAYMSGSINLQQLQQMYAQTGSEGFDVGITRYGQLLEKARELGVSVRAGFVPRSVARLCMNDLAKAKEIAREKGWIDADEDSYMSGTEEHFRYFKSLITGDKFVPSSSETSSAAGQTSHPPSKPTVSRITHSMEQLDTDDSDPHQTADDVDAGLRRLFPAQVIKDVGMANAIANVLRTAPTPRCRVFALCGSGHCEYGLGIPERVQFAAQRLAAAANGTEKSSETSTQLSDPDVGRPVVITCKSKRQLLGEYDLLSDEEKAAAVASASAFASTAAGALEGGGRVETPASVTSPLSPGATSATSESAGTPTAAPSSQLTREAVASLAPQYADWVYLYNAVDEDGVEEEDAEVGTTDGQWGGDEATDTHSDVYHGDHDDDDVAFGGSGGGVRHPGLYALEAMDHVDAQANQETRRELQSAFSPNSDDDEDDDEDGDIVVDIRGSDRRAYAKAAIKRMNRYSRAAATGRGNTSSDDEFSYKKVEDLKIHDGEEGTASK
ncbi:hypothetical protein HK102_000629 [Quaeritorhiza haematococci]|nr:hypothetical protein HK102_000629 [Quaeritorhiza haematococci]